MKIAKKAFRCVALLAMFGVLSCNQGPVMRGQIAGLSKLAGQAERNGAIRCAPRELALAKSHLKFAELELDQGFVSRASHHLAIAEPNAHAAYDLSPPETCAERGLVIAAPPEDQDTDGDGIMDSRDQCILEPEDKDGYLDEDGCPEIDNDLDGILDTADKCPNDPEDPDGFEDSDGCPDPDNDKDTVLDVDDQCPNEPGPPDGDRPGCPRKPALVVVTDKEIKITQQIHFEFDKDVIRSESFPILDAVAEVLQKNPDMRIEIQPNDTEQNRALNRRVQFMRTEGGQTP